MVPSPTPKRDHGDPQSFRLRSEATGKLVRAEGLEPSRTLLSNGFSYPAAAFAAAQWGLGSRLSLNPCRIWFQGSGAARLSLYTFPAVSGPGLARDLFRFSWKWRRRSPSKV